jgi:hypothetical protein
MADGQPLRIGNNHTSDAETRLERSGAEQHSALSVDNAKGNGIVSRGVGSRTVTGVLGVSEDGVGVAGNGGAGGVRGSSHEGIGVSGRTSGDGGTGVEGASDSSLGTGVVGTVGSTPPSAIFGVGVFGGGEADGIGVLGTSESGTGVTGNSRTGDGVRGLSNSSNGVKGLSTTNHGVEGSGPFSGIHGISPTGHGVFGDSPDGRGVFGRSNNGIGVLGQSDVGFAGQFIGGVRVTGLLEKLGGGFKMDHPLDPENKYLSHSFVESPDMKNVYDGVAVLDEGGATWVELPQWFEALNRDFRYQLTAIGAPAPELHVAEEMSNNRFEIAGGRAHMKVSWQVTGIRQDEWANANRIETEEEKPAEERGHYLHQERGGQPEEPGIDWEQREDRMRQVRRRP